MIRSNLYDGLPSTISNLKNKLTEKENVLQKADGYDKSTWQPLVDSHNDLKEICSSINAQFKALKSDYEKGIINMAKYKGYLQSINDLLTNREEALEVPELNTQAMALELKKLF